MKTLIIPDIHQKVELAQQIMDNNPTDRRVFLGDIYDDFGDSVEKARTAALWHKEALKDPKNTFLFGNHDLPYCFPKNQGLRCSGYTHAKRIAINDVGIDWNSMKLFTMVDGWLLSHAGIHPALGYETLGVLANEEDEALKMANSVVHPLLQAGWSRGGSAKYGGLTWLDWSEFKTLPGFKQIVGHSRGMEPRVKANEDGPENWCIDCDLRYSAIIDDGNLELIKTR